MSRETICCISALMLIPPFAVPGIGAPDPVVLPVYIPPAVMSFSPWPACSVGPPFTTVETMGLLSFEQPRKFALIQRRSGDARDTRAGHVHRHRSLRRPPRLVETGVLQTVSQRLRRQEVRHEIVAQAHACRVGAQQGIVLDDPGQDRGGAARQDRSLE